MYSGKESLDVSEIPECLNTLITDLSVLNFYNIITIMLTHEDLANPKFRFTDGKFVLKTNYAPTGVANLIDQAQQLAIQQGHRFRRFGLIVEHPCPQLLPKLAAFARQCRIPGITILEYGDETTVLDVSKIDPIFTGLVTKNDIIGIRKFAFLDVRSTELGLAQRDDYNGHSHLVYLRLSSGVGVNSSSLRTLEYLSEFGHIKAPNLRYVETNAVLSADYPLLETVSTTAAIKSNLPSLRSLTANGLVGFRLSQFPALQQLQLDSITAKQLGLIGDNLHTVVLKSVIGKVKTLRRRWKKFTAGNLKVTKFIMPELRELELRNSELLTAAPMNLQSLNLRETEFSSDWLLQPLQHLSLGNNELSLDVSELRSLELWNSDKNIDYYSRQVYPCLQQLQLKQCVFDMSEMTMPQVVELDIAVLALNGFPRLSHTVEKLSIDTQVSGLTITGGNLQYLQCNRRIDSMSFYPRLKVFNGWYHGMSPLYGNPEHPLSRYSDLDKLILQFQEEFQPQIDAMREIFNILPQVLEKTIIGYLMGL